MKHTALITGASGGLGHEFARLCATDGMNVILTARSADTLKDISKELSETYNVQATVIPADMSDPKSVEKLIDTIQKSHSPLSVLINNAGFGLYGPVAKNNPAELQSMIRVNVESLTLLTRAFVPNMIKQKYGRILNVASTAAFQPGPLMAVYYASKAYVQSFSIALSNELQGTGVTATCVCPGPTNTGFATRAKLGGSRLFKGRVMDAATVARIGYNACMHGKTEITPGVRNKVLAFATRFASRPLGAAIARRVQSQR